MHGTRWAPGVVDRGSADAAGRVAEPALRGRFRTPANLAHGTSYELYRSARRSFTLRDSAITTNPLLSCLLAGRRRGIEEREHLIERRIRLS